MDKPTDPLLEEFFLERGQKEKTRTLYHYVFDLWFKVTGNSPTAMIEEAEDDEDNRIRLRKRRIKKHLENHAKYLEKKDFSQKYIQISLSIIRTFYNHFDIQLPKTNATNTNTEDSKTIDDIPNRDEIREAPHLLVTNPALIHLSYTGKKRIKKEI